MVKIGEVIKTKIKHKTTEKLNANRGKFVNFAEIGKGEFINCVEIGEICNMHLRFIRRMAAPENRSLNSSGLKACLRIS